MQKCAPNTFLQFNFKPEGATLGYDCSKIPHRNPNTARYHCKIEQLGSLTTHVPLIEQMALCQFKLRSAYELLPLFNDMFVTDSMGVKHAYRLAIRFNGICRVWDIFIGKVFYIKPPLYK